MMYSRQNATRRWLSFARWVLIMPCVVMLASCCASPDVNNDPRSGGFFGGIRGGACGDYAARQRQRSYQVTALKSESEREQKRGVTLEEKEKEQSVMRTQQQRRLSQIDREIRGMKSDVGRLKEETEKTDRERMELAQKLEATERQIDNVKRRGGASEMEVENLTRERDLLYEEYEALRTRSAQ